jgi:hypothetical protein
MRYSLILALAVACVLLMRRPRRGYVVRDDWRRYAMPAAAVADREAWRWN